MVYYLKEAESYNPLITYHYSFYGSAIDKYGNKLLPIDKVKDINRIKDYANRARKRKLCDPSLDDEECFNIYCKYVYDMLYRRVLNRDYIHYGIFTTPINLFSDYVDERFRPTVRIKIDLNNLNQDLICLQTGGKILNCTEKHYHKLFDEYIQDEEYSANLYNEALSSNHLGFKKLPQIVIFEDYIRFKDSDVEYR